MNVWIDSLTISEIVDRLDHGRLFTVNVVHLYNLQRDATFAAAYQTASLVSCDSQYILWGMKFLGRPMKAKASGSDIFPAYWRHHAKNHAVSIFLLGAEPGVADTAARRINRLAGRDIVVGAISPSFNFVNDPAEIEGVIGLINESGATCLVLGLGSPKQEIWIHRYGERLPNVKVFMGLGATIDYEAGAVRRAPQWMARNGLESVFRVVTDPKRYAKRYILALEFFWLLLLDRLGLYRPPFFLQSFDDPHQ